MHPAPDTKAVVRFSDERDAIRAGGLRGAALLELLAGFPPGERDGVVDELLGIHHGRHEATPLGGHLVGYIPSGLAAIVGALNDVPVGQQDVFVDVGAGLGKVVMLAHLLTGARGHGVELQSHLVTEARACAAALNVGQVSFELADARHADWGVATVFFLYFPFSGPVLRDTLAGIHVVAQARPIVLCTLGFDLVGYDWLLQREANSFWLSIYDSRCPGVPPRSSGMGKPLGPLAERIANEQP